MAIPLLWAFDRALGLRTISCPEPEDPNPRNVGMPAQIGMREVVSNSITVPIFMVHPCLAISKVLRVVCGSLWRRDLLSVALTCRGFLEPALDELWYEIRAFNRF